jgi:hypothetical protein
MGPHTDIRYSDRHAGWRCSFHHGAVVAALAACLALLVGCGGGGVVTKPVTVDAFLDATYSNDQVAAECLEDIKHAAQVAAESRGRFFFHTFDGDPLRRRGTTADFAELEVPARYRGTSKEVEGLRSAAEKEVEELWPEVETLAAEKPVVPETPLAGVLTRAARIQAEGEVVGPHRIVICTDGLFTDVNKKSTSEGVHQLGASLRSKLSGATIDFIGLAVSVPGTGPYVEKGKPPVEELLAEAEATMGVWDVELPAGWEPVPKPREKGNS